ncbi:MAG: acyl-CoA dehydrogenase family protein [Dehalococcoidia bacterium]
MQLKLDEKDQAFRDELNEFLDRELPADWSPGMPYEESTDERAGFQREFVRKLATRKWLAMAWPSEYGGLGASHHQQLIYNEVMSYRQAPGAFSMGVAWVGPALMLYGSDEQKKRFLPGITSGDDVWCTLYSEPIAGSDLAALQTKAIHDGDDYVINGQKIWTSGARNSNWGWLAARTDFEAPKHKGISTFVVPMDAPGVSIRPLINMAGEAGFNEVFFEDVRIPKDFLVGEENRGWYQVAVALDFERSGIQSYSGARRSMEKVTEYVRANPDVLEQRPQLRNEIADRWIEIETGTIIAYRITWMQSRGMIPNHEASMSKLFGSELTQRVALTTMHTLGMHGQLEPGSKHAVMGGSAPKSYNSAVASTVAAGTSEIQRGIIAGRGLGLPRG